jgi:hypothetical protein
LRTADRTARAAVMPVTRIVLADLGFTIASRRYASSASGQRASAHPRSRQCPSPAPPPVPVAATPHPEFSTRCTSWQDVSVFFDQSGACVVTVKGASMNSGIPGTPYATTVFCCSFSEQKRGPVDTPSLPGIADGEYGARILIYSLR